MKYPDWENFYEISLPFVAPEDGFVSFYSALETGDGISFNINGSTAYYASVSGAYKTRQSSPTPVKKGDIITLGNYSRYREYSYTGYSVKFYPCK